jgi:hypothetical protein
MTEEERLAILDGEPQSIDGGPLFWAGLAILLIATKLKAILRPTRPGDSSGC